MLPHPPVPCRAGMLGRASVPRAAACRRRSGARGLMRFTAACLVFHCLACLASAPADMAARVGRWSKCKGGGEGCKMESMQSQRCTDTDGAGARCRSSPMCGVWEGEGWQLVTWTSSRDTVQHQCGALATRPQRAPACYC